MEVMMSTTKKQTPKELISVTSAAELLHVGRSTVIYLINENRLEAFNVPSAGGKRLELYVPKVDVERMARNGWRNPLFGRPEAGQE